MATDEPDLPAPRRKKTKEWIGIAGLALAVLSIPVAVLTPQIQCGLGLRGCPVSEATAVPSWSPSNDAVAPTVPLSQPATATVRPPARRTPAEVSANRPTMAATTTRAKPQSATIIETVFVSSQVPVGPGSGGVETGIAVGVSSTITFEASATVQYGYEGGEFGDCGGVAGYGRTDASGNRTIDNTTCTNKIAPDAPMPGAPVGSLIGRIGDGSWFFVGQQATIEADDTGRLFLAHNDSTPEDNAGAFKVVIHVVDP